MSAAMNTSKAGTGRSGVLSVNNFGNPFNVGLGTTLTGTATYNIEFSLDDPMDAGYVAASATWFAVGGMNGLDSAASGNLTVPCKAVSINITSGSGTVVLYVRQAGER